MSNIIEPLQLLKDKYKELKERYNSIRNEISLCQDGEESIDSEVAQKAANRRKKLEDEKKELEHSLLKYEKEIYKLDNTHPQKLLDYFHLLNINFNLSNYDKYENNIKTILFHSNTKFPHGLYWLWANLVLKPKKEENIRKADANSLDNLHDILKLFKDDEDISEDIEIECEEIIEQYNGILDTKDIIIVLDNAKTLLEKENKIHFFSKVWIPIVSKIIKLHKKHELILILVQNGGTISEYRHFYTDSINESISNSKPLIFNYNGFGFINNEINHQDFTQFKQWIENDLTQSNESDILFIKKTQDKQFFKDKLHCDDAYYEYLKCCEPGTVEKLFMKISKEFGFKFNRPSNKHKWLIQ